MPSVTVPVSVNVVTGAGAGGAGVPLVTFAVPLILPVCVLSSVKVADNTIDVAPAVPLVLSVMLIVGVVNVPPAAIFVVGKVACALPFVPGIEKVNVESVAPTTPVVSRNCTTALYTEPVPLASDDTVNDVTVTAADGVAAGVVGAVGDDDPQADASVARDRRATRRFMELIPS